MTVETRIGARVEGNILHFYSKDTKKDLLLYTVEEAYKDLKKAMDEI